MRELTSSQLQTVGGGFQAAFEDQPQLHGSVAGWEVGGSVVSGSSGTGWSASGGFRLPGGSTIGGHIGGFGGSVTGGGLVVTIPF